MGGRRGAGRLGGRRTKPGGARPLGGRGGPLPRPPARLGLPAGARGCALWGPARPGARALRASPVSEPLGSALLGCGAAEPRASSQPSPLSRCLSVGSGQGPYLGSPRRRLDEPVPARYSPVIRVCSSVAGALLHSVWSSNVCVERGPEHPSTSPTPRAETGKAGPSLVP